MSLSPFTVVAGVKQSDPYNIQENAPLEVRYRNADGSSGNLALIYFDAEGTLPITQPGATCDSRGTLLFYAEASSYNVIYSEDFTEIVLPVDVGASKEWVNCRLAYYVSSNEFYMNGDLTEEYSIGRKLRVNNSGTYEYAKITGSTFSATQTNITTDATIVGADIVNTCASIVSPESFTVDLTDDLSQTINFDTAAEYKAFTKELPVKKRVYLADRDGYFNVISGIITANDNDIIANDTVDQSIVLTITPTTAVATFGASPANTASDNAEIIARALEVNESALIDEHYDIDSLTVDFEQTIRFTEKGRLTVAEGEVLNILGVIDADMDYWIFDSIDEPTNFSDPDGLLGTAVTTTAPIIIGDLNNTYLSTGGGKPVSAKWFGATGAGLKLDTYNDYAGQLTLPSDQFVNDTKGLRLCATALAKDPVSGSLAGNYAGTNLMHLPVGMYCVDEEIYISGGTTLTTDAPARPNRAAGMIQTNCDKDLLVLQSRGVGGLGGGGTSHVIQNLLLGYRPCSVSATNEVGTIKFVDNKFNLDSSFHNLRFSNSPTHGACILVNSKEARSYSDPANPTWGYGSESGLRVSAHLYDCMFDVAQGVAFKIRTNANVKLEVSNGQFFDQRDGLIYDAAKSSNAPNNGESEFIFRGGTMFGCGSPANSVELYRAMIYCDNPEATYLIDDVQVTTFTSGVPKGGRILMNTGKKLVIANSEFTHGESNSLCYAVELAGYVKKVKITNNDFEREGTSAVASISFGSSFYAKSLSIKDNDFECENAGDIGHLFFNNPSTEFETQGILEGNSFSEAPRMAIFGNTNPNMQIVDNTFATEQSGKGIAGINKGMTGHNVTYSGAIPTEAGTVGDICWDALCDTGGKSGWRYTTSNEWKAFGDIDA